MKTTARLGIISLVAAFTLLIPSAVLAHHKADHGNGTSSAPGQAEEIEVVEETPTDSGTTATTPAKSTASKGGGGGGGSDPDDNGKGPDRGSGGKDDNDGNNGCGNSEGHTDDAEGCNKKKDCTGAGSATKGNKGKGEGSGKTCEPEPPGPPGPPNDKVLPNVTTRSGETASTLAVTGVEVQPLTALALLLVVLGAGLVMASRKERSELS